SLEDIRREEVEKVINSIGIGQMEIVKEQIKDFVKSLERRQNRDIHRVYDYYHILIQESQNFLEKKCSTEELKQKTLNKIEAIKTELKWKTNDLISKYKLNIQMEPITFIRIESKAPVLWIEIKRRKLSRLFPVTYNLITRHLDNLPCESCFNPVKPYYICDDKLHIVCSKCFKLCSKCGKNYCSVCFKSGCPKCG
ncbi:hypothetical protein HY745_13915, partial [Candidatus Desantisbacteria bacterium]|nr:hypothetical protein [Candidatus Desantisbacteria bacterium]